MSEEKSYGEIAKEIFHSVYAEVSTKSQWEDAAQAVIAEYLRRNGEPVAWISYKEGCEFDDDDEDSVLIVFYESDKDPARMWQPLYDAPQLPSVDELANFLMEAFPERQSENKLNFVAEANAVLELLKRGK